MSDEPALPATQAAAVSGPSLRPGPIHRDRQYRRLWLVGTAVALMRWVEILAFAVFTYERTESALWVASLMTLRMLPLALFGLSIGALAARVSRRRLLLALYGAMGLTHLVLLLLSLGGQIEVWHLAVASGLSGFLWACDMPLRRALMSDLAGPRRVAQAMSLDAVAGSACRLLGPALGGWLILHGGLAAVFCGLVLLYLPLFAALVGVRETRCTVAAGGKRLSALLVGGFEAARQSPQLRAMLWLTIVFNLFAWPVLSMVPVIAQERLSLDPQGVGLLTGVEGVGSLLGALLLSAGSARWGHGRVFLGSVLCFLALQTLMAWSPLVMLTAVTLLVLGVAQVGFAIMQSTLVYTAAPERLRAEAMGLLTMCIGASPLGFLGVGAIAERLGAPTATLVCAVCGLLCVALSWKLCRACLRDGA